MRKNKIFWGVFLIVFGALLFIDRQLGFNIDFNTIVTFWPIILILIGLKLLVPIIASPMNTVCGGKMAKALADLKCLGIIHRFNTIEEQLNEFTDNSLLISDYKAAAIGINQETEIKRLKKLADTGIKIFCIDLLSSK